MSARLTGDALDAALFGLPTRLGVIIATTTSKNNDDTATPFNDTGSGLAGKLLVLVPDVACTIKAGSAATVAAVATDYALEANKPFPLNMPSDAVFLAARATSGTVNLVVFELR